MIKSKMGFRPLLCAFCLLACRPQDFQETNGSAEQFSIQDVPFCAKVGIDKCNGSNEIVGHANELAARSYYFSRDPCSTDGQRDAFRHIYAMVWISSVYGIEFAKSLSDHQDPDPAQEKNPQVVCQRNMDRRNNAFAIKYSQKILSDCKVSLEPNFEVYKKHKNETVPKKLAAAGIPDRYTDCVGGEVYDYIMKSNNLGPDGPVVIQRAPKNATQCWLVPANTTVAARGRTVCDSESTY